MVHAIVLIKSAPGRDVAVRNAVAKVEGVKETHPVTGPWDLVAVVDVTDLKTLGDTVMGKIRMIEGVCETCTLVCVE